MENRKRFDPAMKAAAVARVNNGETTVAVARDLGVSVNSIYSWTSIANRKTKPARPYHKKEKATFVDIPLAKAPEKKVALLLLEPSNLKSVLEALWK